MNFTMLTRKCLSLALVMGMTFGVGRSSGAPRDQVAAANGRALEGLRAQVVSEPIGENLTVADLLSKTGTGKKFNQVLARAQQIGGPRWLDGQTCQVRLEIAGPVVARALVDTATLSRLESPVPPDVLAGRLKQWDRRTFTAIGTSTAGGAAELARPVYDGAAWSTVADESRRVAVAAARKDAVARVMEIIRPIHLGSDKTVAQVLEIPEVATELEQWLAERPVTQVEFRDDLQVRMTLAVPAAELFEAFRASAAKHPEAMEQIKETEWYPIRDAFVARMAATACRGLAQAGPGKAGRGLSFDLPRTPPDWIETQLEADGGSSAAGSRLKAARAAEADAIEKLRIQLESLPLTSGSTVGDAARQDKQVAGALDRALGRARTKRVDYLGDGGARVVMTLELSEFWNELHASPGVPTSSIP